jgi:predicted site-specific integrase-resolvase
MKLSEWAKLMGISRYRAWQLFKEGKIPDAKQLPNGRIIVFEKNGKVKPENSVAIYAWASWVEPDSELDAQVKNLKEYALEKGYKIKRVVKEVSGTREGKPRLAELLRRRNYSILLIEEDRLIKSELDLVEAMCREHNKTLELVKPDFSVAG